ncbi:MAG TPA: alanine--tRNA ligase, partial [Bacteroidetes bacterium]|nr:alanine--tRNA ligase [Bacteroidota bacterium]
MTSIEIRNAFFSFFEKRSHKRFKSAPIVIKNDPSLMFTNAGMNQFKSYFTGDEKAKNVRLCNTQKCLRVSGKHNDLDEVGVDTYHHTMFEMLGNWSFGDYFKKEAINWAWELLTEVYAIDKERLYVTVFNGDEAEGVPFDEQAFDIWNDLVDKKKIFGFGKKENFWEMGETGPCGPCSEIHIDLRSEEDINLIPASELLNKDHPEVIEIWNLVFMEFNRKADKSLLPLEEKHVDTGMGLERLCMVLQNKRSNYDTDIFVPLIKKLEDISGLKYALNQKTDIASRVIVDHIRALSFSIADGQLPSNTGAGYVIRRILRRAVRYGYSYLNIKEPALFRLVSEISDQFREVFPELYAQKTLIEKVIREEEVSFLRTLNNGLRWLDELEVKLKKESRKVISGNEAFVLYDTYGFPLDLSSLIAIEKGLDLDEKSFAVNMQEQKDRSRAAAKEETGDWVIVHDSDHSKFTGYGHLNTKTLVHKYRMVRKKDKELIQVILKETPLPKMIKINSHFY